MPYKTLSLTMHGAVAHVALNRPKALNAFNMEMFFEMKACFEALSDDASVRAVVLSGNGRFFTAGLDLKEAAAGILSAGSDADLGRQREQFRRHVLDLQSCQTAIDECRVPVIAAVHSGCLGAGVDIVTACDIRIMSADAYFTIQEINVGIVADIGTLQRIPHLLPLGTIKDMAYTGRKMLAEEALRLGFVASVETDQEATITAALAKAHEIASKSPLAIAGVKQVINAQRDKSIHDGLDYVATWNAGMLQGNDVMTAVKAVMSKQEALFDDLLSDN